MLISVCGYGGILQMPFDLLTSCSRGAERAHKIDDCMDPGTTMDDPISTFIGDEAQQNINIGKLIGCIRACGFDLAFAKAQDSATEPIITLTSARLELLVDEPGLKVTVKEDILTEVSTEDR